ncbi:ATP-binding protein [Streptomyces sp. NPDC017254]|uniref:ATP-binding protein n=1 Tax=unclassified Streptomyces TaxID=2593676 RepID=UPI003791907D
MVRKPWELQFLAEPGEIAGLRRVVRLHLKLWGLSRQSEAAQLCAGELASLVFRQGGAGTSSSLRLSMRGTFLRIEVRDSGVHTHPTLAVLTSDDEADMGLALVDGIADRWGVLVGPDHKGTWCEIATDLTSPHGHSGGARVTRAEAMISLYGAISSPRAVNATKVTAATAKDAVIEVVADLLRWVDAHGYDTDDVLDAAQARFDFGL